MWNTEIEIGVDTVLLTFECIKCQKQIESDEIPIPSPNQLAENSSESAESDSTMFECPHCKQEYNVSMFAASGGSNIEIEELPSKHKVKMVQEYDALETEYLLNELEARYSNFKHFQMFEMEIRDLKELSKINISDILLRVKHNRHLLIALISSMEEFLSGSLLNIVVNKEKYLKKFVKNYKGFKEKEQKYFLSDIFEIHSDIKNTVIKEILKITFHNLATVQVIYQDTFGIQFPSIKEPMQLVSIRHDLVHRNGKTKDGIEHLTDDEELNSAITIIETFVNEISQSLREIEWEQ